jgi:hypothetical protein
MIALVLCFLEFFDYVSIFSFVFYVITMKCWHFLSEGMGVIDCKVDSVGLICYDNSLWKMVTMVQRALSFNVKGF